MFDPLVFTRPFDLAFIFGDYQVSITSHETVTKGNTVEERFIIDAFYQGLPFNWNGDSNRETFIFSGKSSQDIYDDNGSLVGTKRGADIRSRFFPIVLRRFIAAQQGVRMGQVDSTLIDGPTTALVARLKGLSLSSAIEELVG